MGSVDVEALGLRGGMDTCAVVSCARAALGFVIAGPMFFRDNTV